jgi:alpha-L-rhamnosidase
MLEIPANTSAMVYLPAKKADNILEKNIPINKNSAIVFKGFENDRAIFEVGSGNYNFLVKSK